MNAPNTQKHGVFAWLGAIVVELRRQRSRLAAYRALAELDDRTLQDIGIARHEIWSAVDAALDERTHAAPVTAPALPATGRQPAGAPANDADAHTTQRPLAA